MGHYCILSAAPSLCCPSGQRCCTKWCRVLVEATTSPQAVHCVGESRLPWLSGVSVCVCVRVHVCVRTCVNLSYKFLPLQTFQAIESIFVSFQNMSTFLGQCHDYEATPTSLSPCPNLDLAAGALTGLWTVCDHQFIKEAVNLCMSL